MPNRTNLPAIYPAVDMLLDSVADWIKRYRQAIGIRDELAQCGPDDVLAIANDIGISPSELREVASKGPDAADELVKMLVALQVDPKSLAKIDPRIARDLERLCISCSHKRRCGHELAAGTAGENYREFCPNAVTLDALFKSTDPDQRAEIR